MSFVGENEVALEQFSAIMCSTETGNKFDQKLFYITLYWWHLGKKDFCTAMEFLFGRDLSDIGMDSVEDLYHQSFVDTRYALILYYTDCALS